MSHRERILKISIILFNQRGVGVTSTNHIAKAAAVSPGNLYFHFSAKSDILRELFNMMAQELETLWLQVDPTTTDTGPKDFINPTLDVFWRYRFFHREMYAIRRQDPLIARNWRRHLQLSVNVFEAALSTWERQEIIPPFGDATARHELAMQAIITASTSLQFYEAHVRTAPKELLKNAEATLLRLFRQRSQRE